MKKSGPTYYIPELVKTSSTFTIPAGKLVPGQTYLFSVTVFSTAGDQQTSTSADLKVSVKAIPAPILLSATFSLNPEVRVSSIFVSLFEYLYISRAIVLAVSNLLFLSQSILFDLLCEA